MRGQVHRKHESWDNLDSKRATTGGEGHCYSFSPPGEEIRSAHHIRWLKALPSEVLALDNVRRERSPRAISQPGSTSFMYVEDTIVAPATPPGKGAVAIVRLSGGDATRIATALWHPLGSAAASPRRLGLGEIRDRVQQFPFQAALKHLLIRRGVPIEEHCRRPLRALHSTEKAELDRLAEELLPVVAR